MNQPRSIAGLVVISLGLTVAPMRAQSVRDAEVQQGTKNIRTLKEIRGEGVVRQRWDMSCGAAALSTLLTYDFKDYTPETAIVVWILHRVDPVRVRARGGFSLLDLKRFAQARGYHAEGFSGMSIEELATQKTSVITPIRMKGFDHFVVVKGIANGHVILADPGFGNLTMKVSRFQELWKNGIVFIVHPPDERMIGERKTTIASRMVPDETIISRKIGIGAPSNALY
ncbi:MAG: peptidase [Edaphobacter sp.]|nr:peptidase [Edaphobacter sp.]